MGVDYQRWQADSAEWALEFTKSGIAKFWYGEHKYEVVEPYKVKVFATNERIFTFSEDLTRITTDIGDGAARVSMPNETANKAE